MVTTEQEMNSSHGEVGLTPLRHQLHNHSSTDKSLSLPFTSLGRQSSIYSLTLDEFQHTLYDTGKSFGSMNMDEFLSSIWTAEENQAAGTNNTGRRGISKQPSLGSLTLPHHLCRKTVDEVWFEIHNKGQQAAAAKNLRNAPRQPTFGEMTLEDFLVKAGVQPPPPPLLTVGPLSLVSSDGMVGNPYSMDIMSGFRGRKRIIDGGPVEKVVERRQCRMIKNRESAARSRARKQAYTVELEAELNQLKDENKQLKQALVELERKRKQQYVEELRTKGQSKAHKARERQRLMTSV
ncbi:unnamed protein product [Linum trigynum]|uniref:BZIP domain-containing protein n=1 Tax=Linum trigynum TaxID=586398 RepID=A0AAV2F9U6_9ROSI